MQSLSDLMDPGVLLAGFGPYVLAGLGLIVFIESGVLFPFLPGDSLLVTATILRDELDLNIWAIVAVAMTAAFLGDQVGYFLGHRFGRRLFSDDARILRTDRLETAEAFFARRGPLALVLGRFIPIVRTFVPFAAGTAEMPYPRFIAWNVTGAVGWVASMVLVGLLLGGIPGIADSIDMIMIVIVVISVSPMVIGWLRSRRPAS